MALLASFLINKQEGQLLEDFLDHNVFSKEEAITIEPTERGEKNFNVFLDRYKDMLQIEQSAITHLKY